MSKTRIVVVGGGYIGTRLADYFQAPLLSLDVRDLQELRSKLRAVQPNIVINAAAKTRTNDLEKPEHQAEGFAVNVGGAANLLLLARELGFRLVQLSTGMQFDGLGPDQLGWTETMLPNPQSYYAWTKTWAEQLLTPSAELDRTLIVRLALPISVVSNPRNLLNKLPNFKSVLDAQVSMSVVEDLLSAIAQLIDKRASGIFNIVNPGTISFWQIIQLMLEEGMLTNNSSITRLTKSQFDQTIHASGGAYQPSTYLNTDKLQAAGILLPDIHQAIRDCIRNFSTV